jgi:hypothetical protein
MLLRSLIPRKQRQQKTATIMARPLQVPQEPAAVTDQQTAGPCIRTEDLWAVSRGRYQKGARMSGSAACCGWAPAKAAQH